jgi:NADPH-dependent curcumin reductase CurA
MQPTDSAREIHLASRPNGWPTLDNFAVVEREVPSVQSGQALVHNQYLSVDPYMRGRMNDVKSYVPPFSVGEVMDGGAVGTVVESHTSALNVGDTVAHQLGWREYAVADAQALRKVDPDLAKPSAYLGVLGMPGLTAYVGLLDIAAMRSGDTVFVSGAAGAVGSLAGQLARQNGARRVIGSAGSETKVAYLREELGFDEAFNYKEGPVEAQLARVAPEGIDVFFDNVGADHLEAAISSARNYGRIALCGAVAQYNDTEPAPGPRNMIQVVGKRLSLRGFIVLDHFDRYPDFVSEVGGWLRGGDVQVRETVVDGIENMPEAFIGLLNGDNIGKMLIRIPE